MLAWLPWPVAFAASFALSDLASPTNFATGKLASHVLTEFDVWPGFSNTTFGKSWLEAYVRLTSLKESEH